MVSRNRAEPAGFFLPGGPTGILLLHGYTGSAAEMRLVAEYLNERGLAVAVPLLPGHGTTVEDLNRRRWQEWTATAESTLAELQARCRTVFVGGLSMGALLTLYLAARHPELAGAIAYSPATRVSDRRIVLAPLLRRFVRYMPKSDDTDLDSPDALDHIWSYDQDPVAAAAQLLGLQRRVRTMLPQVRCPLLVIYSPCDRTIAPDAGRYTYERAGSRDKRLVALERSGHCITVDSEWEKVAEESWQFIVQHRGLT